MDHETAKNLRESLIADCTKCFGLFCTALHIVSSSGFPMNKPAGTSCRICSLIIHSQLRDRGLKAVQYLIVWVLDKSCLKLLLTVRVGEKILGIREKMFQVFFPSCNKFAYAAEIFVLRSSE